MLPQIIGILTTGFLLGIQHSFEPDHVAAVSTFATRAGGLKKSAWIGALWGLGHTSVLLLVGLLVLLFRISIPQAFSQFFEFLVGVMLLYLGLLLLKNIWIDKVHIHKHHHGQTSHTHFHSHKKGAEHQHAHRSFFVGMIHGLAGSAGVVLLILASISSITEGVLFILTFGLGSILGMAASGMIISLPLILGVTRPQFGKHLTSAIALVSVSLGIKILGQNWIFLKW